MIMRKNEVEISGVPDEPPSEVKKNLEKKKKKMPNIEEETRDVPPISSSYQAMHIDPRGPKIQLDNVEQMSPFDLFSLYINLVENSWWSVLGRVYLVEYTNDDRHQRRSAANNDKPTHLNGSPGRPL